MMKESAYSIKNTSTDAVVACVFAGLSVCSMIGAIVISYIYDGDGPAAVGLLGIAALLMAIMGIVFTISSWKSEDGGILMKRIAGIVNAIPLLIGIVFYILGWIL